MQPDYYANTIPSTYDPNVAVTAAVGGFMLIYMLFWSIVVVITVVALWKIFTKAGKPGWASIIPIYNTYVMLQIAQKPWWWLLLMFVPVANLVVAILMLIGLGKAFGKGAGWSIALLLFLSPIGMLMLAFGKSEYQYGGKSAPATTPATPMATPIEPTASV